MRMAAGICQGISRVSKRGVTMNEKNMLFLYNPMSGKELLRTRLMDVLDIFVKAGYEVTAHPTQSEGDARRMTEACSGRFDRIVCSGGDGTLNEVMTGMMHAEEKVPIGYIPSGSTNDFAQSLNIPKDMTEAAKTAVGDHLFSYDVGCFGAANFIYVAAFGIFTDVSYLTSHELKHKFGHGAYILEGMKSLKDIPHYEMEAETEGRIIRDRFMYGTISNSFYIGGVKSTFGEDIEIRLDDGLLEVSLIRYPQNPKELNQILTNLMMPRTLDTDCIYRFQTDRITFRTRDEVPWSLDGEFGGTPQEVEISCSPGAVDLVIP